MGSSEFKFNVEEFVRQIPPGRVMTYGQLAALAGSPQAARIVGGIAHFGDSDLPWHRVVNKQGGLASGYPGGRMAHTAHLEAEGTVVKVKYGKYVVDVEKLIWWPSKSQISSKSTVVFIVGPTASGKSKLAMELAKEIGGEIICADSQTIRKGLDIGTAKPTKSDQAEIPHHLLDIVEPYESFSVNQFKSLANKLIIDIQKRGKTPIVVGGTGLYIDSLYFDYEVDEKNENYDYKKELELMSVGQLQKIIEINKYKMPENNKNPRHLIGTILRDGKISKNNVPISGSYIFGLMPEDEILKQRISDRVDKMFNDGFADEVKNIISKYGRPNHKIDAIGYQVIIDYIDDKISLEEAKILFKKGHWQYARRQKSWFKRNEHINWLRLNNRLNVEIIKELISS